MYSSVLNLFMNKSYWGNGHRGHAAGRLCKPQALHTVVVVVVVIVNVEVESAAVVIIVIVSWWRPAAGRPPETSSVRPLRLAASGRWTAARNKQCSALAPCGVWPSDGRPKQAVLGPCALRRPAAGWPSDH